MPKNEITVTLSVSNNDMLYIDGWVKAANNINQSPENLIIEFLREKGKIYAQKHKIGSFPSSDFILRFTPTEYQNIITASQTDPQVARLLNELRNSANATVDDPRLGPGLDYLVFIGLLTLERRNEVIAYERPEPTISN